MSQVSPVPRRSTARLRVPHAMRQSPMMGLDRVPMSVRPGTWSDEPLGWRAAHLGRSEWVSARWHDFVSDDQRETRA